MWRNAVSLFYPAAEVILEEEELSLERSTEGDYVLVIHDKEAAVRETNI